MSGVEIPTALRDFLANEVVCCLAVPLQGSDVHVAPLLFWCDTSTLAVYMTTSKKSEKMWWQRAGEASVKAGVAIGLQKSLPFSIQMRGILEAVHPNTNPEITQAYLKIASELDDPRDPTNQMIRFTPTWARYTDRENNHRQHDIAL